MGQHPQSIPSVHQALAVCLGSSYTGIGISLYSSTPSRSSNTGSASLASSCGRGWSRGLNPTVTLAGTTEGRLGEAGQEALRISSLAR